MASAKSSGRTCTAPDTSTPRVHRTGARLFPSASPPHALRRNGREQPAHRLWTFEAACKTLATQHMNRSASQGNSHPHPARPHPKPAFRVGLGNAVPSLACGRYPTGQRRSGTAPSRPLIGFETSTLSGLASLVPSPWPPGHQDSGPHRRYSPICLTDLCRGYGLNSVGRHKNRF